eukprot:Blabericola_migrator_1__4552@NODE_2421_length_2790_cov_9_463827_g1516_i0_p1_GENE_NODE_2421_length_2790_cov_9_463827_g1516_i0NODE_2421_length_2790_cov_9_463827_g1516_i0_p1_ORF_typecomplete_len690_score147_22OCRE/PF17780_1/5_4e03OCRE/PF17780_1/0_22DUF1823/PF08853_11/0_52_NODE_2421_length_2790_cov_9_463827_g1516_i03162385
MTLCRARGLNNFPQPRVPRMHMQPTQMYQPVYYPEQMAACQTPHQWTEAVLDPRYRLNVVTQPQMTQSQYVDPRQAQQHWESPDVDPRFQQQFVHPPQMLQSMPQQMESHQVPQQWGQASAQPPTQQAMGFHQNEYQGQQTDSYRPRQQWIPNPQTHQDQSITPRPKHHNVHGQQISQQTTQKLKASPRSASPASVETAASPTMDPAEQAPPLKVSKGSGSTRRRDSKTGFFIDLDTGYVYHPNGQLVNPLCPTCPMIDAVPAKLDEPEPFWDELYEQGMGGVGYVNQKLPSAKNALHIAQWALSVPLPPQIDCSGIIPMRQMDSPTDKRLSWFYKKLAQHWGMEYKHCNGHDPSWEECNKTLWPSLKKTNLPDMTLTGIERVYRLQDYHAHGCMPKNVEAVLGKLSRTPSDEAYEWQDANTYKERTEQRIQEIAEGVAARLEARLPPQIPPGLQLPGLHVPPQSEIAKMDVQPQWPNEMLLPKTDADLAYEAKMQQAPAVNPSGIQHPPDFGRRVVGDKIFYPQPEHRFVRVRHGPPPAPKELSWPARQAAKFGNWLVEKFPQVRPGAGVEERRRRKAADPEERYLNELAEARIKAPDVVFGERIHNEQTTDFVKFYEQRPWIMDVWPNARPELEARYAHEKAKRRGIPVDSVPVPVSSQERLQRQYMDSIQYAAVNTQAYLMQKGGY